MTTNQDLAEIFRGIADLLDLQGERFKPEAYRRAARSIEALPEDIRRVEGRGELDGVPGVGAAIGEKIREYLRDGRVHYYDRLRSEIPAGVLEIMRLPGVGPKTARRFLVEFAVEGPAELTAAIENGRLANAKGFGERKIELLRQALAAGTPSGARTSLMDAWKVADRLVRELSARAPVEKIEVAGSFRRRRETVGDLDLLVTSTAPEAVFDAFSGLPGITEVKLRGATKETVVVDGQLQVDLRVVEPAAFGAALQYFTGSKDHNVRLRTLARDHGLKVNEYGVFEGESRVAGATEEEVYSKLGLPWIPPEIRENHGEFEAAATGRLPALPGADSVRGELHVHLEPGADLEEVDRLLREAGERGWSFLGFVVDAAQSSDRLAARVRSLRPAGAGRAAARLGVEIPVGPVPPTVDADYVVWDLSGVRSPPVVPKRVAAARFATHLSLAAPGVEATSESTSAWVDWAHRARTALEVAPQGAMAGLDSAGAHRAEEAGVPLHLTAGVRTQPDRLASIDLALGLARRGWVRPERLLNREDPRPPSPGRGL